MNHVEWKLPPALSDCVPGHITLYLFCAQHYWLREDLRAAHTYLELATFLVPFLVGCLDPTLWFFTVEDVHRNYKAFSEALENGTSADWT